MQFIVFQLSQQRYFCCLGLVVDDETDEIGSARKFVAIPVGSVPVDFVAITLVFYFDARNLSAVNIVNQSLRPYRIGVFSIRVERRSVTGYAASRIERVGFDI